MENTMTWPETLRGVWERYSENGYSVILRDGIVYLFHGFVPRHCLATEVDRGSWISRPAMSRFVHSHLYEDMAGEIESRVLPPWRHVSSELTPLQVLEFRQTVKDCYCYKGVGRCDFCTGIRLPDFATWESASTNELREMLTSCGYAQEYPCRFLHPTKGWASIMGLGSATGLPTVYCVKFQGKKWNDIPFRGRDNDFGRTATVKEKRSSYS
jgi:hypothetical protein